MDLPHWAPPEAAQVLLLGGDAGRIRGHLRFDALEELDGDDQDS